MSEDAGAIGSAISGEESGGSAESRESGSAWEDAARSDACTSVARGPATADVLDGILAAIADIDAGEVEVGRNRLLVLAAALRALGHAQDEGGV